MSLSNQLEKRKANGALRQLKLRNDAFVDFSSNDYLGLARSKTLKGSTIQAYQQLESKNGATGSRLLTGNSERIIALENKLALLFGFESSTVLSSGYIANLALFSSLPQRSDTVIYDELSHACIKDGIRLSLAKKFSFKHNDLEDLEQKLKRAEGDVYVACESVYSMDGDIAPLPEIAKICKRFKAKLIIDEAHSTGVWGTSGQGLAAELALQKECFAVVHTFGKAMGIHGASISGSKQLKEMLVNFARPFIYTTAPSDFEVIAINEAFDYLAMQPARQAGLFHNIELFNQLNPDFSSPTAIKSVAIGGNEKTKTASKKLQTLGYDIRPILSPTVAAGTERLRICLHSFNTDEQIKDLSSHLRHLI